MEVRVLGPIEVSHGAGSVVVGTRMHRAVLSLLVMEIDRVVSLDRLIDCLWGDDPPSTATGALHVYISGLRKVLEPDRAPRARSRVLVTEASGYALRVPPQVVDVGRFEALVREGQALLGAGRPASACHVLDIGLGLWRGPAYQDLAFESFLQPEIARLNQLRATAGETRAEALLAVGRDLEGVVDITALIEEDPLRERRWGLLALALYRTGRQGEALRTLDRARRKLGEDLGVELGPDLRRLEQDILSHSPALEWRAPVARPMSQARRVPLRYANEAANAFASDVAPTAQGPREGRVLPPEERPHGVSLQAMGAKVAPFTNKDNDPALYPDTPFQILYVDDVELETVGNTRKFTGTNAFTVPAGTTIYVPVFGVNENPPIPPGFPTTPLGAGPYLFDAGHWGSEFTFDIDGMITAIGPQYAIGPVPVANDGPLRTVILGVFVAPLAEGRHTVTIRGSLSGRGVAETYGVASFQETLIYTVEVVTGERGG